MISDLGPLFGRVVKLVADVHADAACRGILIIFLMPVAGHLLGRIPARDRAIGFLVFLGLAAGFWTVESARVVVFMAMAGGLFRYVAVPIYFVSSVTFFLTG